MTHRKHGKWSAPGSPSRRQTRYPLSGRTDWPIRCSRDEKQLGFAMSKSP